MSQSIPVISISGRPFERGRQYGEQAREYIEKSLASYRIWFEERANLKWEEVLRRGEQFRPFIENYDPDILEEMRGMAAGAGCSLEEIVAINARSELLFVTMPECTSLGITPEASADGSTIIGQNWDLNPATKETIVILKIHQPPKPDVIAVTEAGLIGKAGVNSAGIGLVTNLLVCRGVNRVGVPRMVINRGILNSTTMSDAIRAVVLTKRSSSSNYVIGHAGGEIIDLETAPHTFHALYPEGGVIGHANHFVAPREELLNRGEFPLPDSLFRHHRVNKLLRQLKPQITLEDIKNIFRDHFSYPDSICRHANARDPRSDQWETIMSIIVDLTHRRLIYTEGQPCTNEYKVLGFEDSI
ncbi:MAG: isopenicillin-N N-acyltransferase like protein [Clostridia bacterium]|nr:isopenicillin-N N-acyltransferase like protein [Clostridia bacterium]